MENKKRCPKCGEENPSEAVMCWACYTPLTQTAHIGAGAGASSPRSSSSSAPTFDDDDEESKPSIPPWQIAIIAIGLMFALFTVGKNFLPSGSSDAAIPLGSAPVDQPMPGNNSTPSRPSTNYSSSGSSVPAPQKLPFTIAVSPNPNRTVGTMAIVPTNPNISTGQAAALASFTRSQFSQMKRWKKLYIYVFQDQKSAQVFANYQRNRRGAALTNNDYRNLTNLWGSVLSVYEYSNGSERIYTPTNNPSNWWND